MAAQPKKLAPKRIDTPDQESNMSFNDTSSSKQRTRTIHECEVCFLTFVKRSGLKRHLERFIDPKYPCDKCGLNFADSDLLRAHVNSLHGSVVIKPKLRCPICDQGIRLERNFQSHLFHRHNGWENIIDINLYTSESGSVIGETESGIDDRDSNLNKSNKRYLKKLIRCLIWGIFASKGNKEETIAIHGNNSEQSRFNNIREKSGASTGDKNLQPNRESSERLRYRGDFKEFRSIRMAGKNLENGLPEKIETGLNMVIDISKVFRKKSSRRSLVRVPSDYRPCRKDAALRKFYSCKDCYVPLSRMNLTKKIAMETVTGNDVTNGATENPRTMLTQVEKSTIRTNDSEKCDNPVRCSVVERHENNKLNKIKLMDVRVRIERLSCPVSLIKSKTAGYEYVGVSSVVEKSIDHYDNNTDNSSTLVPSSSATEMDAGVANEIPRTTTEKFAQYDQLPTFAIKAESMDCGVDDRSAVTTESVFPEFSRVTEFTVKSETINDNPVESSNQLTIVPIGFEGAILSKIEIDDNTYSGYSDCGTEHASESPEIRSTNDQHPCTTIGPLVMSSTEKPESAGELPKRIASKICDKTFVERRSMLRHAREKHLMCIGDTVYCTCGKEMIGRRAMERHFSRHCSTSVEATDSIVDPHRPCKPLDKKYVCGKCGEKFWLESCLRDHPPNCEIPKGKPMKKKSATENNHKPYETAEHYGDDGPYGCQICGVKFTRTVGLSRHERTFATNEIHPCYVCGTLFPGSRLLKGHVQSTHDLNPTTCYKFFCDVCNQGFTRKVYKRIHMMHIHNSEPRKNTKKTGESTDIDQVGGVSTTNMLPDLTANMSENQCNVCNLVFVRWKGYIDHMSYYAKTEGRSIECNACGEKFDGQYKAHNHRKMVHYGGKVKNRYAYCCGICEEGFTYKTHLHAHMFHVHDKEFNCVTSVTNLNEPKNDVIESAPEEKFSCNQCPKVFPTSSILLAHIYSYHAENLMTGNVRCSCCDVEFSTFSDWEVHYNHAHIPNANDPPSIYFPNKVPMLTQVENFIGSPSIFSGTSDNSGIRDPPNTEKPQSPETDRANGCKPTAGNIGCDNDHPIVNVINDDKMLTHCSTCGFDCGTSWGLSKHRAAFDNAGNHACELCGRRFGHLTICQDHKLKHLSRNYKYFCPICDEGFTNVECLEMHTVHLHQRALAEIPIDTMANSSSSRSSKSSFENNSKRQSYSPTVLTNDSTSVDNNRDDVDVDVEDRFYVSLCPNTSQHEKNMHVHDGVVAQTNNLYRYFDQSFKCHSCDVTFATKDLLNVHNERLHTVQHGVDVAPVTPELTPILDDTSTNIDIRSRVVDRLPQFEPGGKDPTINEISSAMSETPRAPSSISVSQSPFDDQLIYHRCSICDIFFSDGNLLAVHEKNVHRLASSDSSDRRSPVIATDNFQPDIVQLPIESVKVNLPTPHLPVIRQSPSNSIVEYRSSSGSPSGIVNPNDLTHDTSESSSGTKNSSLIANKKVRFINLPPGNYKISKLKVRPVNMTAGILMKTAIGIGNKAK